MTKIDISSLNIDEYYNSIDTNKIKNELQTYKPKKFKKIIDNLENIIKADIPNIENLYLSYCSNFTKKEKKFIENTFNYSYNRNSNKKFMEHFKKLNIKSCPFCNNNHVYFYKQGVGKVNTLATLEHYYPKAQYPHLSLSFYNLIPSCSACKSSRACSTTLSISFSDLYNGSPGSGSMWSIAIIGFLTPNIFSVHNIFFAS